MQENDATDGWIISIFAKIILSIQTYHMPDSKANLPKFNGEISDLTAV